ncbi:MAG TPA: HYR domain-containing protein [Thermoanaerobaculia bacterium]|nr:HYR domain-containing protein [Thermoanaerobaculia bacterium]
MSRIHSRFLLAMAILFLATGTIFADEHVLTIYFCGTGATSEWNDPARSGWHRPELIASLYENDGSHAVRHATARLEFGSLIIESVNTEPGYTHYKYIADGFGTPAFNVLELAEPDLGPRKWNMVVDEAVLAIEKVVSLNPGDTIALNLLGWSRGGILCMKTARRLANDSRISRINILAFDPVPGCPDPIGKFGDDLRLPAKVGQFVGIYAAHELSNPFEPVIPWKESDTTKMWLVSVPGSHETMMGNFQIDGHHDVVIDLDWSYDPAMAHIFEITRAIAEQLLTSAAWNRVPVYMLSPGNDEQFFQSIVNSMWDYRTSDIMAKAFLGWSTIMDCHTPSEMLRAGTLFRSLSWRLCFVAPNRHVAHWAWVWDCSPWWPLRLYDGDLVYWLDDVVTRMNLDSWAKLQSFRAATPETDHTPPEPMAASLPDLVGECGSLTVTMRPTAKDAVSGTITGATTDPLEYTAAGTYTIHWTYQDEAGNTATQTQTAIVRNDTVPPGISAPPNVTRSTASSATSCDVTITDAELGVATAGDECSGEVPVTRSGVPPNFVFPVGTTTLTYTATDGVGNSASATQTIKVIDATAPRVEVPADIVTPTAAGRCSADVSYSFTATDNCLGLATSSTPPSGSTFTKGTTLVTINATDAAGNTIAKTFNITVQDKESPSITNASARPAILWPPNHELMDVAIEYNVADNCQTGACTLSVVSSEPVDDIGDGSTTPDWVVAGPHSLRLRAERNARGPGRIYAITISCNDAEGNPSVASVEVRVPSDQRK